jgi:hypothetical protein
VNREQEPSSTDDGHPALTVALILLGEFAVYAAVYALQSESFKMWLRQRHGDLLRWRVRQQAPAIAREAAPEVWWEAWMAANGERP